MKRLFGLMLVIATITISSGCSNKIGTATLLDKEGVAPYELSESDTYLLQSLGLQSDANIILFKAPEGARGLNAEVHVLADDGTWNTVGGGTGVLLLNEDAMSDVRLEGTFAMLLKEDYSIDMHITTLGRASIQSRALDTEYEITSSVKGFLTDFQEIELNKEIPVAIMVYDSGTSLRSYSLDSYFSPSEFEGVDLVQVVTLTFTDKVD